MSVIIHSICRPPSTVGRLPK